MIQRHTPWSLQEGQGQDSYIMDSDLSCVGVVNFRRAADGRFIVAAVNAHADMLAALEAIADWNDQSLAGTLPHNFDHAKPWRLIRAAIAKASPQAPGPGP